MYLSTIKIENFRCFGEGLNGFELQLKPGLTALVGENDAGKTAVIDALRFVFGTTDQEWYRLEDTDFHRSLEPSREIRIVCKFENLTLSDKRAFVEYLSYGPTETDETVLFLTWTAKDTGEVYRGRPYRRVEIRSGREGDGPKIESEAQRLLRATYLRPLRDAEQALTAGRGSRLSQILQNTTQIKEAGRDFDPNMPLNEVDATSLNVLGIGDFTSALLKQQKGIQETRTRIDEDLDKLSLHGQNLKSDIRVGGAAASEDARLRQMLEKLDLLLVEQEGKLGLGSKNLLFMASELLLLAQESEGNKLLLIEEPEAHLHAQRQLQLMRFLEEQATEKGIQIIVTTHSPNLASAIDLDNVVMIQNGRAFSLAKGETKLEPTDYRFLQRFLDVTKANLFFASGVAIVEGDAENILLPTLASLIGRDFTEHGVSVVNVSGVGLRRYARIFQRRDEEKDGQLDIPVACVTDMDVMPDCGVEIIGKKPRTKTKSQLGEEGLAEKQAELCRKTAGQMVETFVADEWTLEYDLAFSGLAKAVFVAACLAKKDEASARKGLDFDEKERNAEAARARKDFRNLQLTASQAVENGTAKGSSYNEVIAAMVYSKFAKDGASKPIAAQYLAQHLCRIWKSGKISKAGWRKCLPNYLIKAIDHVTAAPEVDSHGDNCGRK